MSTVKTFLINLDRSPARLDFMRGQFETIGVDFVRIPAVDGATLARSEYSGSPLGLGEIGCLLSHREAWRRLVASQDKFAAVFEDDARLSRGISPLLKDRGWIPPKAGIVKLETVLFKIRLAGRPIAAKSRVLKRLVSNHLGTAGYIIRRDQAERLLSLTATFQAPVDHYMFTEPYLSEGVVYQISPAPVLQRSIFDDIGDDGAFTSLLGHGDGASKPKPKRPIHRKFADELLRPFRQIRWKLAGIERTIVRFD
ncbi:glycosyltransferase family 25 protein [Aminobacter sp. MET-1]|uniref:glycosyltransferase family 25 protein n=1 Tax=Aminobacter sp. MET-1 TaxID=2951085 RepID=UPI002B40399D|nr:glycosyltransferase family 25 protein [Aminobacter sp. MET-1]